jgi:hypothetical protein
LRRFKETLAALYSKVSEGAGSGSSALISDSPSRQSQAGEEATSQPVDTADAPPSDADTGQSDASQLRHHAEEGREIGTDWRRFWHTFESAGASDRAEMLELFLEARKETAEDHHVELKELRDLGTTVGNESRGDLAKAVSAFANADGGLIVWGIRKKTWEAVPVNSLDAKVRTLNALTGECTLPPAPGALTLAAPWPDEDAGYAVTYVPKSSVAPHQARMGPEYIKDKYFRRHRALTCTMLQGELDDMFGRRPHPDLVPQLAIERQDGGATIMFVWRLKNEGPGTAFAVTLEVTMGLVLMTPCGPQDAATLLAGNVRSAPGTSVGRLPPAGPNADLSSGSYIPISRFPIRSQGGAVNMMGHALAWENLAERFGAAWNAAPRGWYVLEFWWTAGAHGMPPRIGKYEIVCDGRLLQCLASVADGTQHVAPGVADKCVRIQYTPADGYAMTVTGL